MHKAMARAVLGGALAALSVAWAPALAQGGSHLIDASKLTQVSPHVWMIRGFPNIGFVVGTTGVLVIDTGLGEKNGRVVAGVAQTLATRGQKLYLTTTHFHTEHASGDIGFPPGVVEIRPQAQQDEMDVEEPRQVAIDIGRSAQDKALLEGFHVRKADILFDDAYALDLGDVGVSLYWYGAAHTKGDELVMVEPDSVLFTGDVVQNRTGPNFFTCAECTPRKWLAVLDQVQDELHPAIVVPDHSDVGGIALIAQERGLMADIQARSMALKAQGKPAEEAGKILAREFAKTHPGWAGFNDLGLAVRQAYADPGPP